MVSLINSLLANTEVSLYDYGTPLCIYTAAVINIFCHCALQPQPQQYDGCIYNVNGSYLSCNHWNYVCKAV